MSRNTNSSGRPICADGESTDSFWNWFGKSAAIDRNGYPLVLYHGTNADFTEFDPGQAGKNFGMGEEGVFFTNSPREASLYAVNEKASNAEGGAPVVYPVYVSLQNPLVIGMDAGWGGVLSLIENDKTMKSVVRKALASGEYDGLIARDLNPNADGEPDTIVIALKPCQIKSAVSNTGTFSPHNPHITDGVGWNPQLSSDMKDHDHAKPGRIRNLRQQ